MTGIVGLNSTMDMSKKSPHHYTKVDSLLKSHLHAVEDDAVEEGDQEGRLHSHRTIEEILNDSISDSSSSHSSPPSPVHPSHKDHLALHDSGDEFLQPLSIDTIPNPPYSDYRLISQFSDSLPRAKPPFPPSSSASAQRPSLFSGVRSNAKPGAAFAAAAAASRTFPTPHAHAIKSQRALLTHPSSSTNSADSEDVTFDALDLSKESFIAHDADDRLSLQGIGEGDTNDTDIEDTSAEFQSAPHEDVEAVFHVLGVEEDAPATDSEILMEEEESSTHIQPILPIGNDLDITKFSSPPRVYKDGTTNDEEYTYLVPLSRDNTTEIDDIDVLVQTKAKEFESRKISEKLDDKSPQKLKPLELAEEFERKKASTGLHWEEGAVAQPMRLEGVRRGSTTLGYFDTSAENYVTRTIGSLTFQRDHGSPQVLQVHPNFIAVGMTKGVIVVVPSKYSIAHVDNMETKILMLGMQGDRINAAVTSMCFNQQGDLLLAGYADGHVTIWDLLRASAAKVISGEHAAPVVHTLFLGQDSQVTRQFKAVTGDTKGLLQLHSFSVVPLLNRFSFKTQRLLDGQNSGTVLSASALLKDDFSGGPSLSQVNNTASGSSIGGMVGGVVGAEAGWKLFNESTSFVEEGVVVLVTHQTALVVRLCPALKVYATLSRPDGVREGSMPYTACKCMTQGSESSTQPTAARVLCLLLLGIGKSKWQSWLAQT